MAGLTRITVEEITPHRQKQAPPFPWRQRAEAKQRDNSAGAHVTSVSFFAWFKVNLSADRDVR